jgi:hypothetical protein
MRTDVLAGFIAISLIHHRDSDSRPAPENISLFSGAGREVNSTLAQLFFHYYQIVKAQPSAATK